MSALFKQYPGDTVQTGSGKVDPAQKFKCTTAARDFLVMHKDWKYNFIRPTINEVAYIIHNCTMGARIRHEKNIIDFHLKIIFFLLILIFSRCKVTRKPIIDQMNCLKVSLNNFALDLLNGGSL